MSTPCLLNAPTPVFDDKTSENERKTRGSAGFRALERLVLLHRAAPRGALGVFGADGAQRLRRRPAGEGVHPIAPALRAGNAHRGVGIELEGLEGDCFEPAQYETLAGLCAAVAQNYPIANIAGHEHVAPARKHDPGAGFDWAQLRRSLGWSPQCFPSVAGDLSKP